MDEKDMTAEEFRRIVGRDPEMDDLDRVNCDLVGTVGHQQCGFCQLHHKPRFICGCIVKLMGDHW